MEFDFDVTEILPSEMTLISVDPVCQGFYVEEIDPKGSRVNYETPNWTHKKPSEAHSKTKEWSERQQKLAAIIDRMGKFSGLAQNLKAPITEALSLLNTNQRLYFKCTSHMGKQYVIGMLKTGYKKLFLLDEVNGGYFDRQCLCLMDFYICDNMQRMRHGLSLFQTMLSIEGCKAHHLSYDCPSEKLLKFLNKHYKLKETLPQPYKMTIFTDFYLNNMFDKCTAAYVHDQQGEPTYGAIRKGNFGRSAYVNFDSHKVRRNANHDSTAASCLRWYGGDDKKDSVKLLCSDQVASKPRVPPDQLYDYSARRTPFALAPLLNDNPTGPAPASTSKETTPLD